MLTSSSRAFQRDLGRYWRYIRSKGQLRLTSQSYVYKNDLKAINETLSVPSDLGPGKGEADNGRLYFIRRLLLDLEVVEGRHDTHLRPILDTPFWGLAPIERVKRTFEAWRDGSGWNELLQLPTKKRGYHHSNPAPEVLKDVRATILKHIKAMGSDGWVSLYGLIDRIRLSDYGFLFPERKPRGYSSYYSYRYYGLYTTPYYESNNPLGITFEEVQNEADGWEKVEANLIAHIVAGPLYWMGLVDLGYGPDAQPDPVNPPQPLAYRASSSIWRKPAANPSRTTSRRSLEEWQALHERIVLRRGVTLAQTADAETLNRLLEDAELDAALGRRIADNVTLPPGSIAKTLAPYLDPFPFGPRPLAAVDRQHLDTVQRLLAERGIEIQWGLR